MFRIGQGYDVHRFEIGRKLILGGVNIPHERGLDGHSDADVLTHAIMDALLGALALGDIGKLFPDNDNAFLGADSIGLLGKVAELVSAQGFFVENIDSTIIAQTPKLAPYIADMQKNIAAALGIPPGRVSVKATTEEMLGFTGRKEGISAHAICLVSNDR